MNRDPQGAGKDAQAGVPPTYEAPRIETVLTPEDLGREVQYAGPAGSSFG